MECGVNVCVLPNAWEPCGGGSNWLNLREKGKKGLEAQCYLL